MFFVISLNLGSCLVAFGAAFLHFLFQPRAQFQLQVFEWHHR